MSLKITNSEVAGVSLVALSGRIVLGEESNALREKLKSLIAAGKQKIVLNMAEIDYIDSSGLGALVAAHLSAINSGASIRLCNLGKKFHDVPATDQAAHRFRRLRYGSSRCQQFSNFPGRRELAAIS